MFKQKHYACVNININCTHKHEQGVLPRKVDYDKNLHLFTKKSLLRISRKNVKKTNDKVIYFITNRSARYGILEILFKNLILKKKI